MNGSAAESEMLKLRSTATELFLRGNWNEYISLYSRFISVFASVSGNDDGPGNSAKLRRALCSALSNSAEARIRLRDLPAALADCDHALELDPSHLKSLACKGKILLDLHCYAQASDCFLRATALSCDHSFSQLLLKSQKLDSQSKTGYIDLSDWVLSGFDGDCPELAEFVGPVEIRLSEGCGGRGLFATRAVDAGTPLFITKAVVLGGAILPNSVFEETGRMALWKDFVDKILNTVEKCRRTRALLYTLSAGDAYGGGDLTIPNIELFKPESAIADEHLPFSSSSELDVERILRILEENCLTEESVSAKVMGKKNGCYGVGLWILPAFLNHSCCPNSRRLHVGDRVVAHASRDIKAGEEITMAYFDILRPLSERREMARRWGFRCGCARCCFEEGKEMELAEFMSGGSLNAVVERVEDRMKKWGMKGKEKAFLRASFWVKYLKVYELGKMKGIKRSIIPSEISVADGIFDAVGGDERVLGNLVGRMKNGRGVGNGNEAEEVERLMMMARCVYGKVMKRRAMKAFLERELATKI